MVVPESLRRHQRLYESTRDSTKEPGSSPNNQGLTVVPESLRRHQSLYEGTRVSTKAPETLRSNHGLHLITRVSR